MTKVFISSEGIYNSTKSNIVDAKNRLNEARSVSYDTQGGYYAQVNEVRNEVRSFYNRLNDIYSSIYNSDITYRNLNKDSVSKIKSVKSPSIISRKGL